LVPEALNGNIELAHIGNAKRRSFFQKASRESGRARFEARVKIAILEYVAGHGHRRKGSVIGLPAII
jgi:hypothetical protein